MRQEIASVIGSCHDDTQATEQAFCVWMHDADDSLAKDGKRPRAAPGALLNLFVGKVQLKAAVDDSPVKCYWKKRIKPNSSSDFRLISSDNSRSVQVSHQIIGVILTHPSMCRSSPLQQETVRFGHTELLWKNGMH